jgi:hypothetical protein
MILNDTAKVRDRVLKGHDGNPGWMSSSRGKAILYDTLVEEVRNGSVLIRDEETKVQLAIIEGATLRAPEGEHDDRAVALALAVNAAVMKPTTVVVQSYVEVRKHDKRRRNSVLGRAVGF